MSKVHLFVDDTWLERAKAWAPSLAGKERDQLERAFAPLFCNLAHLLTRGLLRAARHTPNALHGLLRHFHQEWTARLLSFVLGRWPNAGLRLGPFGRDYLKELTKHEREIIWRSASNTSERGLHGLVWSLQAWHDHVVRTVLAAMETNRVAVVNAAGACRELEEFTHLVFEAKRELDARLVYPDWPEIRWPAEVIPLTEQASTPPV